MEVSNKLVSWFIAYLGDLHPTYIGVIIHLLSTMDIPVTTCKSSDDPPSTYCQRAVRLVAFGLFQGFLKDDSPWVFSPRFCYGKLADRWTQELFNHGYSTNPP